MLPEVSVREWMRHLHEKEQPVLPKMASAVLANPRMTGARLAPREFTGARLPSEHTEIGARCETIRPPLKWAGGKRWLVPYLQPLWRPYSSRRLVEPFVGGLAVTLGLSPRRALLNDLNPHVINLYHWLKRGLVVDLEMVNASEAFYASRERFNRLIELGREDSKQAAELFYYLNRTCYNGLCRFNRSGGYNVPFGRYKVINYVRDFRMYVPVMRQWEFISRDFGALSLKSDDFVYADPPYDVPFTSYSKTPFGWEDQVRLAKWLAEHRGPVVLSNQATERVVHLYRDQGFDLRILSDAPRMINCTGDRTPAREVLATRNL